MAESFERIKAWVKAHPWLTAALVVVAVVVGYIIYKRSQGAGQPIVSPPSSDGTIGQPSVGGGEVTTQAVPPAEAGGSSTGGSTGGEAIPIPGSTFSFPAADMSGAYASLGLAPPTLTAPLPTAPVTVTGMTASEAAYSSGPGGKVTIAKKTTAAPTLLPAEAAYSSGPGGKKTIVKKAVASPPLSPAQAAYSSGPGGKKTVAASPLTLLANAYSSGPGGKKSASLTPTILSTTPQPQVATNKKGAAVKGKANLKYAAPYTPAPATTLASLVTYYSPTPQVFTKKRVAER